MALLDVAIPLGLVAAAALAVAALAIRRPVLFRMAGRNALRRRGQTAVVIAGLMVGTAIIAGSLATGDSLAYGIRKGAYDGLGPVDEFLVVEGQLAFPEYVHEELAANATVMREVRALSPVLYEAAAVSNPRAKQSEPLAAVYGFDAERDRAMGLFHFADGSTTDGSELGRDDAYVLRSLADKLELDVGDSLTLHYSITPPPLVPRIYSFNGTLDAGAGACVPGDVVPPGPVPVPVPAPAVPCPYTPDAPEPATFTVPVRPGAVAASAFLVWFGPQAAASDLDPVLISPSGRQHVNGNGTPGRPDIPAILNVTAEEPDGSLEEGDWTFQVGAKAAASQPFTATVLVFYEVYDLNELREIARELEEAGFDAQEFRDFAAGGDLEVLEASFTVAGIVEPRGKGDFLLGENVFVRLDRAQEMYEREGEVNLILVSNDGSTERGVARTERANATLHEALRAIQSEHPGDAATKQVDVRAVKEGWLEGADEAGKLFKQFLTTIGSFTIVAGVMLIVNIFVMLAEERKSELGMARAVGLTRRQLVLLFGFEGFLYALVASLVGVLLGLALAWVLITGFNTIIQANPDVLVSFPFHPEVASLAWAFASGFFITLATVALASNKVSKLNIVRAIRRIEEPKKRAGRMVLAWGAILALAGLAGTLQGAASDFLPLLVLAPCIGLIGLAMVLTRWFEQRIVYPVAGAVTAAYCTWTIFGLPNPEGLVNQMMGPARGVIIVIAVVLIIVHIPQVVTLSKALLMRFRALVPAVKPGISYPLEKKVRTGLTIAMFALVILVVVAFSTFSATFEVDLAAQSGGYDVEAESTIAIDDLRAYFDENLRAEAESDPFARIASVESLRFAQAFGGELIRIDGKEVEYQGPPQDWIYSYDASFARTNEYEFEEMAPEYATAREVYEAVLADPTLVIVSSLYTLDETGQPGAHQVGDALTFTTPSGTVEFRIVGIQKQFYLGGVWVHPDVLSTNFQRIRGEYLVKLKPGEDSRVAAREIEAAFQDIGMNAVSIEEEAAKQLQQQRQFFTLFQLFLTFGLVVGIASLGIVTMRSVIERRQEVGMLRAIGYSRAHVLRIFLIEILFTTTLGILVGTAIGLIVSYGVVASSDALDSLGITFKVPVRDIAVILGLTYVATLLCTLYPARSASRIPPAEAIRYIE